MYTSFKSKFIVAVALFVVTILGCTGTSIIIGDDAGYSSADKGPPPWAPAHGYRSKYQYYYYPDSYVYYDAFRKNYFYYDGGGWKISVALPSSIRIDAGNYVVLEMDTDEPYKYHSEIVKRYPPGQKEKKSKNKKHD